MDYQQTVPLTLCAAKVTLAAGTTTTLSNTGAIPYCIRGKAYSKAAMANAATPTIDAATGKAFQGVKAGNGSIFLVGLTAAGALAAVQGTIEPLNAAGAFINAPQIGAPPNDFCPIGYLVIKAGATADAVTGWTFGVSNMSGVTGVTYTFVDLMTLPDRPQVS